MRTYLVPFEAEETVWNNCVARVEAESKEEAFEKVKKSIKDSNPFRDFDAEWQGVNTVTSEVIETTRYGIGDDFNFTVEDVTSFQPTTLKKLIENEGKEKYYSFMDDGVVLVKFLDRMNICKVLIQIQKVPSKWNSEIGLTLGYSSDVLAYRKFGGIKRILEFIDNFSIRMEIDFSKEIK